MRNNVVIWLASAWFIVFSEWTFVRADELDLSPIIEQHQMIPMRDGKHLSAWLYFPPGKGPWPVIFEQRYAGVRGEGTRKTAARLAAEGFVVAMVNYRGTWDSEGTWVGYRALGWGELKDGYDTCEWLGTQTWSNGKVGTFGSSQAGYAQNFLAITQPPHLTCQYMVDTGLSLFHEGYRIGGTTRPQRFKSLEQNCRNPEDNRHLLEEWYQHPHFDEYWKAEDCSLHFDKMNVPCFTIGSWYDFMNQGSIASFRGRQMLGGANSRGHQQLIIGPWLHGRLNKTNQVGELQYPETATWPEHEHMVRWFGYWLRGDVTGVEKEPAVRYYVMGAAGEPDAPGNEWRTADDFPPAADFRPYYLHADKSLTTSVDESPAAVLAWESDPGKPMQIPGTSFPGAMDARAFESQAEVLTFTTEHLESPIEWTGRIRAELFLSSTAKDTDIIVRVSDVYPDGRSILICDYPWRMRYREGLDHEVLMTPGEITPVAFDVGWISQIFAKGHRIRVTVASTGAPLYEPNPQNGKPLTIEFPEDAEAATNTLHLSGRAASRILAPIPVRND
ncbi:MAG: CocE/NonD family hydrolase [Planctomyces sp.]|nr:CocE/NonD family hydrolase [Planctomyces sp.]